MLPAGVGWRENLGFKQGGLDSQALHQAQTSYEVKSGSELAITLGDEQ